MNIERKLAPSSAVMLADGTFDAIISTPAPDAVDDVVMPGAFASGQVVPVLVGHDWRSLPVGKATIRPTATDVRAAATLFDTTTGRDAAATLAGLGSLAEFSIGFTANRHRFDDLNGRKVRVIEDLTLHEISVVVKGAAVGTGLVGGGSKRLLDPEMQEWLERFQKLMAIYGPQSR